jgi:hypothetical protein
MNSYKLFASIFVIISRTLFSNEMGQKSFAVTGLLDFGIRVMKEELMLSNSREIH